jgi:hypothetical protein
MFSSFPDRWAKELLSSVHAKDILPSRLTFGSRLTNIPMVLRTLACTNLGMYSATYNHNQLCCSRVCPTFAVATTPRLPLRLAAVLPMLMLARIALHA